MKKPMQVYPDGLKQAILAMSFFRSRHSGRKRFANSKRHADDVVPVFHEHIQLARRYISAARKHGFRGSVYDAVMERGAQ